MRMAIYVVLFSIVAFIFCVATEFIAYFTLTGGRVHVNAAVIVGFMMSMVATGLLRLFLSGLGRRWWLPASFLFSVGVQLYFVFVGADRSDLTSNIGFTKTFIEGSPTIVGYLYYGIYTTSTAAAAGAVWVLSEIWARRSKRVDNGQPTQLR